MTDAAPTQRARPAPKVGRRTMATEVRDLLREQIVLGEIAPEEPLRLEQLAQSLNVSISPVREALRQLESLGLVEHVAYKGARVTSLSAEDLRDVYEARLAVESLLVRKVAERFDEATEARLLEPLAELADAYESGDRRRIVYGNTAFHLALAESSGSRSLALILRPALEASQRYSAAAVALPDRGNAHQIEAHDHVAIVDACRSGDPDRAEELLRQHLSGFAQLISSNLSSLAYASQDGRSAHA